MHHLLFKFGEYHIYAYGFFIVLGAALGYLFLSRSAYKVYGIDKDKISSLLLWIFVTAFIGGKVLFYMEDPKIYMSDPSKMISNLGNGFVFFGSLLFAVPTTIWFFKKEGWNVWGMLDLIAFTSLIVHATGRIGCFMAGCCHGIPTDFFFGVSFTDPMCQAYPLNTPLHPTQIYEFLVLTSIFVFLYWFRKFKTFDGQLFLFYVVLYSVGRSIIETVRGDEERGYLIDGILSHSQGISIVLITVAVVVYFKRRNQQLFNQPKSKN
ncbi:prolipoprotein diacylglyceryl transferase [Salibacteraceae bacterium]|nr:prolipoprotein diacylglyceryl transferase [Salibacteraceae bacterium]